MITIQLCLAIEFLSPVFVGLHTNLNLKSQLKMATKNVILEFRKTTTTNYTLGTNKKSLLFKFFSYF
jgi:hypothetical protein